MEKFEFFPIKCRILRAQASFQKHNNIHTSSLPQVGYESNGIQLNMKVVTTNFNFTCKLSSNCGQVVFYWTLLARHLSQYFDTNPWLKPVLNSVGQENHTDEKIILSQEQESQIKEIFNIFDADGSGKINGQEIFVAKTALGLEHSSKPDKAQRRTSSFRPIEMLDFTSNNIMDKSVLSEAISLEQFTSMMMGELAVANPLDGIRAVFFAVSSIQDPDKVESESTNVITLNKLRQATHKFGVRLREEELLVMMSQADTDDNQSVDEDEFMRMMTLSPWF